MVYMKRTFKVGDILVGDSEQALVIPEIGINHEGSLVVAKELGRQYIGCDINPRAIEITNQRLTNINH